MLLYDTPTQERHVTGAKIERTRQLTEEALAQKIRGDSELLVPDNGFDVTDGQAQKGEALKFEDFKARLLRCNSSFIFERSIQYPELMGIYLSVGDPVFPHENKKIQLYVGGFNWFPHIDEFTTLGYKEEEHPKCDGTGETEKRKIMTGVKRGGWRRTLAFLLHKRYITAGDVEREFPSIQRDSKLWFSATKV